MSQFAEKMEAVCLCTTTEEYFKKKSLLWDAGIEYDTKAERLQNGDKTGNDYYTILVKRKDVEKANRILNTQK